jgi:hypothetical protein
MSDSHRPPNAVDLEAKLAKFASLPKRQPVIVKWWSEQHDPALASLGGVVTMTPGGVGKLDDVALTLDTGMEKTVIQIPRGLIIDLRFPPAGEPISDDELRKMA